jgi:dihydrofolate synthase/folylpolyglutamate synthase
LTGPAGAYDRFLARLERTRALGVDFGLDRMRRALDRLGSPERKLTSVQIAGTNGKGSTAAMAESILRAAGLRTGLFTSPHMTRFTERIRIGGREIDGERLERLYDGIEATGVPLTYFEVATALAFLCMVEDEVEAAILETGLGGRLDAVTVVDPIATAITSIGLDHMDMLGRTLPEIAREKAGIAKPGVPLYLGPLAREADAAIAEIAEQVGAPVLRFGRDFRLDESLPRALAGAHQVPNGAIAVALSRDVAARFGIALTSEAVAAGLASVHWPGRLEWVAKDVLVDSAHNSEGADSLVAALPARGPRALVVSIVRGKDAEGILRRLVPHFDWVLTTRSANPRSSAPEELAALVAATTSPLQGAAGASIRRPALEVVADPLEALARARDLVHQSQGRSGTPDARPHVVVAGSMFLVGEIRACLLGEPRDPTPGGDPLP